MLKISKSDIEELSTKYKQLENHNLNDWKYILYIVKELSMNNLNKVYVIIGSRVEGEIEYTYCTELFHLKTRLKDNSIESLDFMINGEITEFTNITN